MAEKIISNITKKAYFDPKIVGPAILNLFTEDKYEPLVVWNQSMIIFGARKKHWIIQHFLFILYVQKTYINYKTCNEYYSI